MVEVFRTNVKDRHKAEKLLYQIHKTFRAYQANFDLDDCDKILRVECVNDSVQPTLLIELLQHNGFSAEVLPDE
ncbi:hypothetical protein [Pontibacter beigongshangensis]|uniref:hypothetical protein n=1 Tax=Pontibacter beigongshangensis TaxID=2574733 RepID=UPI00164F3A74|nr:hypothetical protein [Pontibacter beigongshangensis]